MRPALEAIGGYLAAEAQDNIRQETSPDGTPFVPLKLATVATKKRKGKIPKALQQDGILITSIVSQVQGNEVLIGSNLPYASIHQLGGEHIPARPHLGINAENEREITGISQDWILLGR